MEQHRFAKNYVVNHCARACATPLKKKPTRLLN